MMLIAATLPPTELRASPSAARKTSEPMTVPVSIRPRTHGDHPVSPRNGEQRDRDAVLRPVDVGPDQHGHPGDDRDYRERAEPSCADAATLTFLVALTSPDTLWGWLTAGTA